jgi:hypothetical protein
MQAILQSRRCLAAFDAAFQNRNAQRVTAEGQYDRERVFDNPTYMHNKVDGESNTTVVNTTPLPPSYRCFKISPWVS